MQVNIFFLVVLFHLVIESRLLCIKKYTAIYISEDWLLECKNVYMLGFVPLVQVFHWQIAQFWGLKQDGEYILMSNPKSERWCAVRFGSDSTCM